MSETSREGLRRIAQEQMARDAETAGFGRATPAPLVSIPQDEPDRLTEQEAKHLLSMTFESRSENYRPHVVSVDFHGVVTCICRAQTPCWAVKAFCRVTGRPVYQ